MKNKFLRLTSTAGNVVVLNTNYVVSVQVYDSYGESKGSIITDSSGKQFHVKEFVSDIWSKLYRIERDLP